MRQLNTNTDELNGLQDKVDARVKQHVDVREELLLRKDKQMKGRAFLHYFIPNSVFTSLLCLSVRTTYLFKIGKNMRIRSSGNLVWWHLMAKCKIFCEQLGQTVSRMDRSVQRPARKRRPRTPHTRPSGPRGRPLSHTGRLTRCHLTVSETCGSSL